MRGVLLSAGIVMAPWASVQGALFIYDDELRNDVASTFDRQVELRPATGPDTIIGTASASLFPPAVGSIPSASTVVFPRREGLWARIEDAVFRRCSVTARHRVGIR